MNHSYVLISEKDGEFYLGSTVDLQDRLRQRNEVRTHSAAYRRPLPLIYYEGRPDLDDARRRERFLKTGRGARCLRRRLAFWLSEMRAIGWNATSSS